MKVKRYLKLFLMAVLFLGLNGLAIFIITSLSHVTPPHYNPAILKEPYQEYRFSPLYSHQIIFNTELPFLYAHTSPESAKYYFTWLREDWSLKNRSSEYLFLASKRVSEIAKFGDQMDILGTFKNISQFRQFQRETRPRVWKLFFNHFGSWESTLARYMSYMDSEVEKIEHEKNETNKTQMLGALQNFVRAHKREILLAIYRSNKLAEEKNYLTYVVNQVADFYESYISTYLPPYDPRNIRYMIDDIVDEKNVGVYDIHIDSYNQPPPEKGYILLYLNESYDNIASIDEKIQSPFLQRQTYFKDIVIDKNSTEFILTLPPIEVDVPHNWKYYVSDENKHVYTFDFKIKKPNQRFFLNFNHRFSMPVTFQYAMVTQRRELNENQQYRTVLHEDYFTNTLLPPSNQKEDFQKHIDLYNLRQDVLTRVNVIASGPIPKEELEFSKISMTPVFEPQISLERTAYLPNQVPSIEYKKINDNRYEILTKNTSITQENDIIRFLGVGWKVTARNDNGFVIEFWPKKTALWLLFLANLLALILIIQHTRILQILTRSITTLRKFKNKIRSVSSSDVKRSVQKGLKIGNAYRLYILIASACSILAYVFLFKRDQNDLLPFLFIFWIIASASYRLHSYLHLTFGFIFISIGTLAFTVQLDALSEKLMIWGYLFFSIGAVQPIFEFFLKPSKLLNFPEFANQLSHDSATVSNIFHKIFYQFILPAIVFIKKWLLELYGPYPKTTRGHVILISKILVTITIFTIFFSIFITIDRKNTRSSFNPQISYLQPIIVYHDTKVLIKGRNFGWKEYEKVRLVYKGGEIKTSFWTDSKIIFTVPLHWKPGEVEIWIEKPTQWEGKTVYAQSEIQKLRLLPRGSTFTTADDEYFLQFKKLDLEVRTLNGYE